jgi:hypothetical protein
MTKPWNVPDLAIEIGVGDYAGDRWLYAEPDAEVACVTSEAPGGPDAWAKMFRAAPAMVRALLAVYEHDKRFRESPEDANRSPIEMVTAALTKAGVPLP